MKRSYKQNAKWYRNTILETVPKMLLSLYFIIASLYLLKYMSFIGILKVLY